MGPFSSFSLSSCSSSKKTTMLTRLFSTESERDVMSFDVLIVGGGPAGLSAAIKLKQLAEKEGKNIEVCVVEKGAEVGSHILSGNVFDPIALNELLPNWSSLSAPISTRVVSDRLYYLMGSSLAVPLPIPPQLHNEGNYIISLANLTRWLSKQAEEAGVHIFPQQAAEKVLIEGEEEGEGGLKKGGVVRGVITKDLGVAKDGSQKQNYTPGMELRACQTLFAEGARGSCSEWLMSRFNLRSSSDAQTYGLGLKEVWELDPALNPECKGKKGSVMHTVGWPASSDTWMGSFLYHIEDTTVLVGMVVGLDYPNPYLSPYNEFQRFKHHPHISKFLKGGRVVSYGARVINEGGLQSVPQLTFPGGALIGCSAGFLNVPRIKGSHTAMKTGMLAAEAIFEELKSATETQPSSFPPAGVTLGEGESELVLAPLIGRSLSYYSSLFKSSWVYKELFAVRNVHPAFKYGGFYSWSIVSAFLLFVSKGREPFTLHNTKQDHQKTKLASECTKIEYPKPDGVLSFDILTNLQKSGVSHVEDQRPHLTVKASMADVPVNKSLKLYAGPEGRFCPARVYEYVEDENQQSKLQINFSNCIHCKTCAIKSTDLLIDWNVPEGGGGPKYGSM